MAIRTIRAAALGALVLCGCQPEEEACADVNGVYLATYSYVNGNCPAQPMAAGGFDMTSNRATSTMMQMRTDDMITTQVVKKGCTVRVSRQSDRDGRTLWQVEGTLDVESKDVLSGPMMRYEWADGGLLCQGNYETVMKRLESATSSGF